MSYRNSTWQAKEEDTTMAGERIIVLDDRRERREFIVDYVLSPNDYHPLVASNGAES
jgi:hypothetical protein